MIQGLGAEGSEGGVLVLVQVPKRGDRLGLCTEFNVEQLMQLLRCVAVVACAAVAVAVARSNSLLPCQQQLLHKFKLTQVQV